MTNVFVSYSSEDRYFADFLVELLKFHHVDVWVDRKDLHAGATFTSDIDQALASCDSLLAVISHHSSKSPWMTREISVFKTANPDGAVIPLVLDTEADANAIYSGLGQVQNLRCYENMLESFRELLRLLGRSLFPPEERRSVIDRRSEDQRLGADRRTERIERRLKVAIWNEYSAHTGRGEFYPLQWTLEVGRLARFLAGPASPLQSFDFVDRQTAEQVLPDFETIESIAYASWDANTKEGLFGVVYTIDAIISELTKAYVITPRDRRSGDRRSGDRRS